MTQPCPPLENYRVGPILGTGQGGASVVRQAFHTPTGRQVALKFLQRASLSVGAMEDDFLREVMISLQLDHPYLGRTLSVFHTDTEVVVVLELCAGGELLDLVNSSGGLSEELALRYFAQLIQALEYCHAKGVAHRDIKPENILLSSPEPDACIKVVDFGLAVLQHRECIKRRATAPNEAPHVDCAAASLGTPSYMPPEALWRESHHGFPADIWAAGCCLFIMVSCWAPFDWDNPTEEELQRRAAKPFGFLEWPAHPWCAAGKPIPTLVELCFKVDPNERPTASQLLAHPALAPFVEPLQISPPEPLDPNETLEALLGRIAKNAKGDNVIFSDYPQQTTSGSRSSPLVGSPRPQAVAAMSLPLLATGQQEGGAVPAGETSAVGKLADGKKGTVIPSVTGLPKEMGSKTVGISDGLQDKQVRVQRVVPQPTPSETAVADGPSELFRDILLSLDSLPGLEQPHELLSVDALTTGVREALAKALPQNYGLVVYSGPVGCVRVTSPTSGKGSSFSVDLLIPPQSFEMIGSGSGAWTAWRGAIGAGYTPPSNEADILPIPASNTADVSVANALLHSVVQGLDSALTS